MLDLAFGLTQTSRLGCQIIMTEELDGLTVTLPARRRAIFAQNELMRARWLASTIFDARRVAERAASSSPCRAASTAR